MNRGSGKVLYHAVSSYQLLEVLLHRRLFHPEEEAALLLPDFIVEKYPQWPRLHHRGFFDEVKLFPYLRIPHGEEEGLPFPGAAASGSVFKDLHCWGPLLFFPGGAGPGASLLPV